MSYANTNKSKRRRCFIKIREVAANSPFEIKFYRLVPLFFAPPFSTVYTYIYTYMHHIYIHIHTYAHAYPSPYIYHIIWSSTYVKVHPAKNPSNFFTFNNSEVTLFLTFFSSIPFFIFPSCFLSSISYSVFFTILPLFSLFTQFLIPLLFIYSLFPLLFCLSLKSYRYCLPFTVPILFSFSPYMTFSLPSSFCPFPSLLVHTRFI